MITASLIINIVVLIPVCIALIADFEKVQKSAGSFTPARGILLAMYITILLASVILLFFHQPVLTFALLFMQIRVSVPKSTSKDLFQIHAAPGSFFSFA
ncbi:MAG: hypothetical protein AAGE93_19315, partial [Bacteroidota bacterium]